MAPRLKGSSSLFMALRYILLIMKLLLLFYSIQHSVLLMSKMSAIERHATTEIFECYQTFLKISFIIAVFLLSKTHHHSVKLMLEMSAIERHIIIEVFQ